MKKLLLLPIVLLIALSLSGCGKTNIWQGTYYENGKEENETHSPVFTTYNACKSWALSQLNNSEDIVNCSKNCNKALEDGTPICEEVVRNVSMFLGSDTFDDYKE